MVNVLSILKDIKIPQPEISVQHFRSIYVHWIILGSQEVLTFLEIKLISYCLYFLIATTIIIIIIIIEDVCTANVFNSKWTWTSLSLHIEQRCTIEFVYKFRLETLIPQILMKGFQFKILNPLLWMVFKEFILLALF